MSDKVGYVLLASAAVPAVIGWQLSVKGLNDVASVAIAAKAAADEAREVVAGAQPMLAAADPVNAAALASTNADLVDKTSALDDGISEVTDALKAMTGPLTPARVYLALCLLLVLGSFVAFGFISVGPSGT